MKALACALVLAASWAWSEPAAWRLSPNGAVPLAMKVRAALVWLGVPVTFAAFSVLVVAVVLLGQPLD